MVGNQISAIIRKRVIGSFLFDTLQLLSFQRRLQPEFSPRAGIQTGRGIRGIIFLFSGLFDTRVGWW
jgi:hypothetical protein